MKKALKPTLEMATSEEWLFCPKLSEKIKEAPLIEKATAQINDPEKSEVKKWSIGNKKNSSEKTGY